MAYIPSDAEWYVAEIVEEIVVEGDSRNVVHRNLNLIHATSPEEAYAKAMDLGREAETEFDNPSGRKVVIRFRGLRDLHVVHDRLEHGAELRYSEDVAIPEAGIMELVKAKEQFSVFPQIEPTKRPDYGSKEVIEKAYELMTGKSKNHT
jgi:hypothetical protein